MKVENFDGSKARQILTGLVMSESVLAAVAEQWDGKLFASPWENLIAGWAIDYWNSYKAAPKERMNGIFHSWAENKKDKDSIDLVERFLTGLSDDYEGGEEDINPNYVLDLACKHFSLVRFDRCLEMAAGHRDRGDLKKAEEKLAEYSKVLLGDEAGEDLFIDENEIASTFDVRESDVLISYSGALGDFFQDTFSRDCFVALLGTEKSGKSWGLLDLAWTALTQRKKVAFFEAGDLTRTQIKKRLITRAAQAPIRSENGLWPCVVKYPTKLILSKGSDKKVEVEYEERTFDAPINRQSAIEACRNIMRKKVKSKRSYFKFKVYPNDSVSIEGIKAKIRLWEKRQGWVPDVVVIDYADILAPPPGRMEPRDQINKIWKQMRALSQELHCLVITATQASARGYERETLDRRCFSEDKRKFAHCTATIGINSTSAEKEMGVQRLNYVVRREGEFSPRHCVYVAGCLPLAAPFIVSVR